MVTVVGQRIEHARVGGRDALTLVSDDARVRATIVPDLAMLCWSLTLDGREFLAHPNDLAALASRWATTGVPLLHPWANRLGSDRLAGASTSTIVDSPRIPRDGNGLPIHGINLAGAGWRVETAGDGAVTAVLDFAAPELVALFPFRHRVAVTARLEGHALEIVTSVTATGDGPVPVSFGWHPYVRLPDVARCEWEVSLPVRRRGELDDRMLPTGRDRAVAIPPGRLGDVTYDDLFTRLDPDPRFELRGGAWSLAVAFLRGYPLAQVYAPAGADLIAFEPMTAPGNALVTGRELTVLAPGETYEAAFAITPAGGSPPPG